MAELVGIVNYGMGNIKSVWNALDYIGEEAVILNPDDDFESCSHLVLPGVGSFAKAMSNISSSGLDGKIKKHVAEDKPLLGICLGMQLLASKGYEGGATKGLDLIKGEVRRMEVSLHLPHVGWNNLAVKNEHPILKDVKRDVDFYFVHSYEFAVTNPNDLIAVTDYEKEIAAVVASGIVAGAQFHPEKSQSNGLKILENFCEWGP